MSCRCSDIKKAYNDIGVLDDNVYYLETIETGVDELKASCTDALDLFEIAIYSQATALDAAKIKVRDRAELKSEVIGKYKKYINDQITKLEYRIRRMEVEDERYHDED